MPQRFPSLLLVSLSLASPFLSIPTCEFVVSFQHTKFSAPVNQTRPLGFFVASVQSEEYVSLFSLVSNIKFGASRLERRGGRNDAVLLLHELLAGGLDGDGKTELGGVLESMLVCARSFKISITVAYLGVVHLTSKSHADRRSDDLLEKAANLTLRVDLCAEDGS
jgi:hypothetical protein